MPVDSPREQAIFVEIDWTDSGLYDHPNSNLSDNAAGTSRLLQGSLTTQRGRDSARPLGQAMVASGSAQVHNVDRLLSPEFAGSPIYQLVEPGRAYRMRMAAGTPIDYDAPIPYDDDVLYDGASILPVVTGFLEEPAFDSGLGAHPTTLACIGSLSRLSGGTPISTTLYQNIRTDEALTHLLDAAGWPAADRVIAVGDTTLALWWLDTADPFNAALEILASEGAPAYLGEDSLGRLIFENRNYRTTATRSTTSRRTFSDRQIIRVGYDDPIDYDAHVAYDAGSELQHGTLSYAPSFRDVRNQATYDIVRRVQQSLQKVWEYGTGLVLGASESKLITVTLSDPCTGALAPVLATDYSVSAGSLASTPTLESVNAQRIGIRFVANAGGATILGVTSNGPQLRAQPWTQVSAETVTNNVDASASITKTKGIRSLAISGRREINAAFALAVANAAVNYYQINRPVVEMPLENIDGIHLQAQLTTEVSDRITIISEHLGMLSGAEFWVEQIRHRREPGKLVTTLVCERVAEATGGGRWDGAVWDGSLWGQ
jgi:hypothetical protein